jgi:hypothetical protein
MAHAVQDKHEAHRRLIDRLRQQAEDVTHLTSGLNENVLSTRTIPEKWSLKELVCHLERVQQIFAGRVDAMLAQEIPAIASYNPEADGDFEKMTARSGKDSIDSFLASREQFVSRLEQLGPAEWHRKGLHPDVPNYDVHFQVEYMAHHEAHHIYQMLQRRVPLGKLPH